MTPTFLTAVATIAAGAAFLYFGMRNRPDSRTASEFFLMGGHLRSRAFLQSYAAASTSVGTVIFFFVILGIGHGLYILFAPATLLLGVYVFNKVLLPRIPNYFFHREDAHFMGTLGELVRRKYQSKLVYLLVLSISILGLLSILLIELFVGVNIFLIFENKIVNSLSLVGIVLMVWAYTSVGGMRSVVMTDRIQVWLLVLPVLILVLFIGTNLAGFENLDSGDLFPYNVVFDGGFILPWPMLLNVMIVNMLLTPCLLRTWQMAASSESREDVRRGMWFGAILTIVLTSLYVLLGVLFYKVVFESASPGLVDMLNTLKGSSESFLSYVLLPAFFVSCFAAILSTVDSALIPIVHSLWLEGKRSSGADMGAIRASSVSEVPILSFLILGIALLLYFGVFGFLGFDLLSWMFTIFSFSIVIAPTIIFALLLDEGILRSRLGHIAALGSLIAAFVVAVGLTLIGNRLGNLAIVQLNSPLGALAGFVPFVALWLCTRKKKLGSI